LGHLVEAYVRAVEATEFEQRLKALELADAAAASA
jgi:aromatic ring hydroxylase